MFRIAAGSHVQVRFIARRCCALDRLVFSTLCQLLECVEDLLANQKTLLYPPLGSARGPDFCKTLLAVENLYAVAIFQGAYLVVNLGQLIANRDLRRGNIIGLEHALMPASAGGERDQCECRDE